MAEMKKDEQLFIVTTDNLETGMRGYPVGYCTTSSVDPEKGLFYSGRPLSEMVDREPLDLVYLLYHGTDPTAEELLAFEKEIKARSHCSERLIEAIISLPREAHPMKLFSIALLLCGAFEGLNDYREDCLNLVAKLPTITAAVINHHAGWGGIKAPNPDLGYIENFTEMLNVPGADNSQLSKVMKLFNILHYDHGGGNLSCFIGKGVASGLEDLYGSLAAAMCGLAGPRHGKANQDSLEFVKRTLDVVGAEASAGDVEKYVRECLENQQLIYGFGHAVLRVEDPRATVLYGLAEEKYSRDPLIHTALLLRSEATKVLKENPKISNPYPNVDAISGSVLSTAKFPYPQYFTVLFGLSRAVGIARQIVYERCEARGGKGTPIIRPKYYYQKPTSPTFGSAHGT